MTATDRLPAHRRRELHQSSTCKQCDFSSGILIKYPLPQRSLPRAIDGIYSMKAVTVDARGEIGGRFRPVILSKRPKRLPYLHSGVAGIFSWLE